MKRPDNTARALLALTGLTVAGLAGVAGAISFSHMATLAVQHGQTGWQAGAFPVSVDGLELVASLYLVAQHRAGRRVGVLPWAALVVGTAASLAANIAVGGHDLVGRALAGWPAISLLVSVKLLFSMFDHGQQDQGTVPDDQADRPNTSVTPGTGAGNVPDGPIASAPARDGGTDSVRRSGPDHDVEAPHTSAALDVRDVAHLIPAARGARVTLAERGRRLSRDALADQMRTAGHGVSSARATLLLKILKAEDTTTPLDPPHPHAGRIQPNEPAA